MGKTNKTETSTRCRLFHFKGIFMQLNKTEVFYRVTVLVALIVLALDLIVWRPN